MKYFIDTEFIEGFHKPLFGKKRHFIDLISIGIVAEDGRQYYAISNEFNEKDADEWVKKNVIANIRQPFFAGRDNGEAVYDLGAILGATKSNKEIAYDIFRFIHEPVIKKWDDKISFAEEIVASAYKQGEADHEFYGYFADYDWVLFCSLFGRMIDLPKGFPMYCRDLKQMLDEKIDSFIFSKRYKFGIVGSTTNTLSLDEKLKKVKEHEDYPKQTNEHNALADAWWNNDLFDFINSL